MSVVTSKEGNTGSIYLVWPKDAEKITEQRNLALDKFVDILEDK